MLLCSGMPEKAEKYDSNLGQTQEKKGKRYEKDEETFSLIVSRSYGHGNVINDIC